MRSHVFWWIRVSWRSPKQRPAWQEKGLCTETAPPAICAFQRDSRSATVLFFHVRHTTVQIQSCTSQVQWPLMNTFLRAKTHWVLSQQENNDWSSQSVFQLQSRNLYSFDQDSSKFCQRQHHSWVGCQGTGSLPENFCEVLKSDIKIIKYKVMRRSTQLPTWRAPCVANGAFLLLVAAPDLLRRRPGAAPSRID